MSLTLILVLLMASDQDSQPQYHPMLGTIKSVDAESNSFEFKSRSGTSTVRLTEKCTLRILKRSTLGKVPTGSLVHILGQSKEINWGSGTTMEMMKVQAIVAAKDYVPPPVPAKLAKNGVAWHAGKLTFEQAQNKFFIKQMTWVHVNKQTVAYIGEETTPEELFGHLKKKKIVWVEAKTLEKKTYEAQKLVLFEGRVPTNELFLVVDPGGKKRKKS